MAGRQPPAQSSRPRLARGNHATRCERLEDGIRQSNIQRGATANEKALASLLEHIAIEEILLEAVVPEIINPSVDGGDPEDLRLEQDRESLLHLHGRCGNVEGIDSRQS